MVDSSKWNCCVGFVVGVMFTVKCSQLNYYVVSKNMTMIEAQYAASAVEKEIGNRAISSQLNKKLNLTEQNTVLVSHTS